MAFNLFPQTDFRQMDLNYVLEVSKQAAANLEEYAADKEQVVATQAAAERALAAAQEDVETARQAATSASQDAQTATQAAGTATQAAESAEQDAQTASSAAQKAEQVQESIPADYTDLSNQVSELKSDLKLSQTALQVPTWTDGKYVAGANVEIENQYFSIADIDVTNVRGKIIFSTYGNASVGWVLLDSSNNVIERSLFTDATSSEYNFVRIVNIGAAGVKLRISCNIIYKDKLCAVYLIGDNDFLPCVATLATDFDDVRKHSVYTVEASNMTVSTNHVPYDQFHGSIVTIGELNTSQQQIAVSHHNKLFTRRKFNTWSQWKQYAASTPTDATNSTDLNSIDVLLTQIGIGTLTASVNHVPYDGFQGQIYTVISGSSFGNQIAVSKDQSLYIRSKYVDWGNWIAIADKNSVMKISENVEVLQNDYTILSEYNNIFCAGDSLTWGAVYTGSGSSDFRPAKKPYNAILQQITGVPVARNAQPGIDAIAYVSKLSSITEQDNQLCIIYLGTNGGLTDTLDTDAPGTDKSMYNTSTETGAYAYIVKHCLDINAKVLLVKIYAGGGSNGVTTTNTVIDKVAEKFGVAVINNKSLPEKYHIWPNGQGYDSTHLNDFGYAAFAEYLIRQINAMSAEMLARILPDA